GGAIRMYRVLWSWRGHIATSFGGRGWTPRWPYATPYGVHAALDAHGSVVLRRLTRADEAALRALLRAGVWKKAYLFGMLHCLGLGPRSRFTGAFVGGQLVGVLGEGRETHCWYASLSVGDAAVAAALARELVVPRVEVLLGREDVVTAAVAALPETRVRR